MAKRHRMKQNYYVHSCNISTITSFREKLRTCALPDFFSLHTMTHGISTSRQPEEMHCATEEGPAYCSPAWRTAFVFIFCMSHSAPPTRGAARRHWSGFTSDTRRNWEGKRGGICQGRKEVGLHMTEGGILLYGYVVWGWLGVYSHLFAIVVI